MTRACGGIQRHAIFTDTKKLILGTPPASCSVHTSDQMTASLQHHRSLAAGTSFTKAVVQQCCVAMRPVVISAWNKTTVAGHQN
jgi:hypothetical protein